MKRFRWTRGRYRKAHHLARLLARFYILPDDAPELVQRYFRLWEQHQQSADPLLAPLRWRLGLDDEIPF